MGISGSSTGSWVSASQSLPPYGAMSPPRRRMVRSGRHEPGGLHGLRPRRQERTRGGRHGGARGAPARRADVAVAGGTIAEVGRVSDGGATVIDASDLVVAPGFIDPHTH